ETGFPQELPRQSVELRACGAGRESLHGEADVALEDARIAVLDLGGCFAGTDPYGAGNVRGAVGVLPARVDQIDAPRLEFAIGLLAYPVMDNRAVRASARNRVEAQVAKVAG